MLYCSLHLLHQDNRDVDGAAGEAVAGTVALESMLGLGESILLLLSKTKEGSAAAPRERQKELEKEEEKIYLGEDLFWSEVAHSRERPSRDGRKISSKRRRKKKRTLSPGLLQEILFYGAKEAKDDGKREKKNSERQRASDAGKLVYRGPSSLVSLDKGGRLDRQRIARQIASWRFARCMEKEIKEKKGVLLVTPAGIGQKEEDAKKSRERTEKKVRKRQRRNRNRKVDLNLLLV